MAQIMQELPDHAATLLGRVRSRAPRVHCLMNTVVQKLVADGLTALGAVPSMTSSPDEIESFVAKADSLSVNLGTLDAQRRTTIALGVAAAEELGRPWVLDPAHCDYSQARATFAQELLGQGDPVLRANTAEFALLSVPTTVVGVQTGEIDRIAQGDRSLLIQNGHPLAAKVTGTGCLSGAVIAAFLAVEGDHFTGAACAMLVFGVAAELAAEIANGPGSFEPALLDVLHNLTEEDIIQRARISNA